MVKYGATRINKDLNHTAIFMKVIIQKQKKMRNISSWLTMSNHLGLYIMKNSLFISLKKSVQKYLTKLRSCHASHCSSTWNNVFLPGAETSWTGLVNPAEKCPLLLNNWDSFFVTVCSSWINTIEQTPKDLQKLISHFCVFCYAE